MAWHRAYYSVIQYCPDLGRKEAANVGVILFCPELRFIDGRVARANDRIIHFFGRDRHDWKQINSFKKGIVERVRRSAESVHDRVAFEHFIDLQANLMQLTPPMPCKVSDSPNNDLDRLFEQLVTVEPDTTSRQRTLRKSLELKFERGGVADRVSRDVSVEVPVLGRPIAVPFGFQNGRFNLIAPVRFEAKAPETVISTACKYAVEGRSLFEHPSDRYGRMKLIVVGKFRPSDRESRQIVNRVFNENEVKLVRFDQVPELINEIRLTGRVVDQ